jgi:hypothetical protein
MIRHSVQACLLLTLKLTFPADSPRVDLARPALHHPEGLLTGVLTRTSYAAEMTFGIVGTEAIDVRQSPVWPVLDLRFTHASTAPTAA